MESLTEEEVNYVRMCLLTRICPRAVRIFFDMEFPPARLDAIMKKEYYKLLDLKKKHIINLSQWNLLFPKSPDVTDSKTFDVTLMITLLRNLTPMKPPRRGFDRLPPVADTTPAADLARINHYTKYLANLGENTLETAFFNTAWTEITGVISRLGGQQMKQECYSLKTKPLYQTTDEVMMDITRSNDEIKGLSPKESHELSQKDTVPRNIRAIDADLLKEWKYDDDMMFIKTRAADHVLNCLKENSCVTITASSGEGKTAILRHVALQMLNEEYDVLMVTNPDEIVKFFNPNQKTLFVIDDLCGTVAVNQSDIVSWLPIMETVQGFLKNEDIKIIAACRLQVFQDKKFESLSVFKSCVCNLQSKNLRLSKNEKQFIAELYLKAKSSEIADLHDLHDCFPLLCKLYNESFDFDIIRFFKNPFSVYEAEIDKIRKYGLYTKYCALALCVMFNNNVKEEMLTETGNAETRTIIENTIEACGLERGTSRRHLLEELNSLKDTLITMEHGVYKAIHNKIFDFLAFYFGHKIVSCLIRHADSGLIKNRFLLERNDAMDQFITVIPRQNHQMYIQRMIDDWSEGKVQDVFSNINMKIPQFRQKFLAYLNELDISYQNKLAHTCDVNYKDTVLLQCSLIGDLPLIRWCIFQDVDINKSRPDGLTPLFAAKGQTEVVRFLLENKAAIFKCRDDWSKDEIIPEEIRNMEQHSIDIYKRALKSGSEKKRNINLVVVGKEGAGKTSLVQRLFGEKFIKDTKSTNGIEIHRRQCKINSTQWTRIRDKDKEFEMNVRIQKSVVKQLCTTDKVEKKSESSSDMSKTLNAYSENEDIEDNIDERIDVKDTFKGSTASTTMETDITSRVSAMATDQPNILKTYTNPQTSHETASKELSDIFKSDAVLEDDDDYTLTLWDFAGDKDFYATHQTFLNPDAVYLVVANLNDKDKDKYETFKFWMETIHCYGCRADPPDKPKDDSHELSQPQLNPPVIIVGTHTDELQYPNDEHIPAYLDTLCTDTRLHVRRYHEISNKTDDDDEFQNIREAIFDFAKKGKTTEEEHEKLPVKFIQLEKVLHAEYTSDKGERVLSFEKVKELASQMSFPITDIEELNLFLRYQHEIGNLLFFVDIPEYIILDPQWLADALKRIVTATKFQRTLPNFSEWYDVKKTGKIRLKLIEAIFNAEPADFKNHQSHLIALMEKFDIIVHSNVQTKRNPTDKEDFFYIPCMMQVNKIEEVDKLFVVKDEYKSMCLCFIFNFLPPYLISHLMVACLRTRKCTIALAKQKVEGLFKDCCVFQMSDCCSTKLLLVKHGRMIELQIWQWDKTKTCPYEKIFCLIKDEIERIIKTRYRRTTVSFEIKWKCSLTSYTCDDGLNDFGSVEDGNTFPCVEHDNTMHTYKDDWCKKSGGKLPAGLDEIEEKTGLAAEEKSQIVSRVVQPTLADQSRSVDASSTTKLTFNVKGKSSRSIISEESTKKGKLTGFSKTQINFAKIAMIVLDVLASVLNDLQKKDEPDVTLEEKPDVTNLYKLLRNFKKNVPSNSSKRKDEPFVWSGKWKDIGVHIEDIRRIRNEIFHSSEFNLADERYIELRGTISNLLKQFEKHNQTSPELYTVQMDNILTKTPSEEDVIYVKKHYQEETEFEIKLEHQTNVQL